MIKSKTFIITACAMIMSAAGTTLFSQETIDDIIINNRGVKYGESNKLDEAIQEFDRAIDLRERAAARAFHNK